MKKMKSFTALLLTLVLALTLTACGGKQDDSKPDDKPDGTVTMTAQEVLDTLKQQLGDSYTCEAAEDEARMMDYYGLDMTKVDSWAAESSASSALDPSTAVVLQVQADYAQDAAALLQTGYEQVLDYCRMYSMNVPAVEQARLFVQDGYVALLIPGGTAETDAQEVQQAADTAAAIDAAWSGIFGSASNQITVK